MGFFADSDVRVDHRGKSGTPSIRLMHDLECKACPLNSAKLHHPKMLPTGNQHPDIYILGEVPDAEGDKKGEQFGGANGMFLRQKIPQEWRSRIMWDNVLRCHTDHNRSPEPVEVGCCTPRHIKTIEQAAPRAIFGFGAAPLAWAIGQHMISNWRGRMTPVKIGKHACWYFPFTHPSYMLHLRNQNSDRRSDEEHIFELDMKRAFAAMAHLTDPVVHDAEFARSNVESVLSFSHESAMRVVSFLRQASDYDGCTGVDFEGSGLRPYAADYKLASIAISGQSTLAFAIDHPQAKWSAGDRDLILDAFVDFIHAEKPRKTVHHLGHELEVIGELFGHEHVRSGHWDDSISQAFVIDQRESNKGGDDEDGGMECYGLGFLTQLYFGIDIKKLSKIDRRNIMGTPLSDVLPYNGIDAKYHKLVKLRQDRELRDLRLTHVYEMHLPRVATLALTQIKGIPLDFDVANGLRDKYNKEQAAIEARIAAAPEAKAFFQRTGRHFKPTSDRDMPIMCREIIGSSAGVHVNKKTGHESYTANKATLLEVDRPITNDVLALRAVSKLESTYVFTADNKYVWPDGKLHPVLNHAKARTSRLTCVEPNGQNFPKRQESAKEVRRQIVALPGHVLLSLDYGQIEARVFAMASGDKNYIKMLWEGFDIHADWARRIAYEYPSRIGGKKFIDDKDVMKKFRDDVKGGFVFALFFGAKLSTAAKQVKVPEEYLTKLESIFWAQFPEVKKWIDTTRKFYDRNGYVELLTGRRRCGPMKDNATINTPVQGTACEIVVDGMNRVSELDIWDAQPILQIHDDLIFHLPEDRLEELAQPIISEMIRPTFDFINVPLVAEASVGKNWQEMVKVGDFRSDAWHGKEAHFHHV